MGMFDTLACEAPLPDPAHQGRLWQTKCLQDMLYHFEITADGQLVQIEVTGEMRTTKTPGLPGEEIKFHRTGVKRTVWDDFTGKVAFYANVAEKDDMPLYVFSTTDSSVQQVGPNGEIVPVGWEMVYYLATFVDGKLQGAITQIDEAEADRIEAQS